MVTVPPDLDDLLDQIESTVGSGSGRPQINQPRRGFYDPVPCIYAPTQLSGTARDRLRARNGVDSSTATNGTEEKLSFVEFLQVTAKEAEELQRLHDEQQLVRATKRVGGAPHASVTADPPRRPLAQRVRDQQPPRRMQLAQPESELVLPEVPASPLKVDEGRNVAENVPCGEEIRLEEQLVKDEVKGAVQGPVVVCVSSPAASSVSPTPSPIPVEIDVAAAMGDDDFDDVLAYLAQCDGPKPDVEVIETKKEDEDESEKEQEGEEIEKDEEEEVKQESDGFNEDENDVDNEGQIPSPVAVTPPSVCTAASIGEVSYQQLPTDVIDESEMERELAEIENDLGSDRPEIVRHDGDQSMDDTFHSAVDHIDRSMIDDDVIDEKVSVGEDSTVGEGSDVIIKEDVVMERQMIRDTVEEEVRQIVDRVIAIAIGDTGEAKVAGDAEDDVHRKAEDDADGDEGRYVDAEEHDEHDEDDARDGEDKEKKEHEEVVAQVDLVFVRPSVECDRTAELEAANEESVAVHLKVTVPEVCQIDNAKDEEHAVAEAVMDPIDIAESSDLSTLVVTLSEHEEAPERNEEVTVATEMVAADTVADKEESVDRTTEEEKEVVTVEVEDTVEQNEAGEAITTEPVPEFAGIEEASDSIHEEETGGLVERVRDDEGGRQTVPCFEVGVEDRPMEVDPSSSSSSSSSIRARFRDRVISDVHEIDAEEAPTTPSRLTESELQLGKTQPIWIPDVDCPTCMLCSARFTFLVRRHHCRACGRVLCGSCCSDRMVLAYQDDNRKSRVCGPCLATLERVEEYERERREGRPSADQPSDSENIYEPGSATDGTGGGGSSTVAAGPSSASDRPMADQGYRKKSILKVRAASVTSEYPSGSGTGSATLGIPSRVGDDSGAVVGSAPRGVVFRDGVKPGERSIDEDDEDDRGGPSSGVRTQPPSFKKKSRKRAAVSKRVAALKVEEQLASALPTPSRPQVLLLYASGNRDWSSVRDAECRLAVGDCVRVIVNRLLTCTVQLCQAPFGEGRVMCVVSTGFHAVGLDEVVFVWKFDESSLVDDEAEEDVDVEEGVEMNENGREEKDEDEKMVKEKVITTRKRCALPLHVIRRIDEILQSSFGSCDLGDVRRVCSRMPVLHSSTSSSTTSTSSSTEDTNNDACLPPLTLHTVLFAPTHQSLRHLPLTPSTPYVFAAPVQPCELTWALAAPTRLLLRLGHLTGCYPCPLVIDSARPAVYSENTSASVLKMFNDFGAWTYRMQHVVGGTVSLSNTATRIVLPRYARTQMRKIVEINRNMLAWLCDVNTDADSHLVCLESDGGFAYDSNIFKRTDERSCTGATFVIIDGALKTPGCKVQVNVCEDGVAVRVPSDGLVELINALLDGKDHTIVSGTMQLRIEWTDSVCAPAGSELLSPIDQMYLGERMQYGLTIERAISSTLQSATVQDTATRLSHVLNLRENNIPAEDEAKVFSVAELIAHEASTILDEYLAVLTSLGIETIALRLSVDRERIEYDVSEWPGLEQEQARFRTSLDKLVPVFVNILGYIPHGFSIEIWLSIVSTTSLPIDV